jgi:site-specific DNA-methyltransferase (adenine-specific)
MDIKTENLWLMQGDCLERMKEIPDGSVDMVLTDPPYILSKSKGGGMMGKDGRKFMEDMEDSLKEGIDTTSFLSALIPLFQSKKHYCGVFFCSNKQLVDYLIFAEANGLQYGVGVWNKTNPAPLCNYKYLGDVEYWVYIKGCKSKILGSYSTKSMVYVSTLNAKESKLYNHPTVKPIPLIEKFLINHTSVGDVVFDPFAGSGSTGVACVNLDRRFIGIELDENYFNIAKNRILGEQ